MLCRFCLSKAFDGAIKCPSCNEYLRFHWRVLLEWAQPIVALTALIIALFSWRIATKTFALQYFTAFKVTPVVIDANFQAPGEDATQVWTTIVLRATNKGTVRANNVNLQYRIGGPCRNYFTNKDIEDFSGKKIEPFNLENGDDQFFIITFTDARHCVEKYFDNKERLEVELTANFRGLVDGKEGRYSYSSKWRTVGKRFLPSL